MRLYFLEIGIGEIWQCLALAQITGLELLDEFSNDNVKRLM